MCNFEESGADGNPRSPVLCVFGIMQITADDVRDIKAACDDPLPILVYRRGADGRLPILVSQLRNTNHVRSHLG